MAQPAGAAQEVLHAPGVPPPPPHWTAALPTDEELRCKEESNEAALRELGQRFLRKATPEQAARWQKTQQEYERLLAENKRLDLELLQQRNAQQHRRQQQSAPTGG